MSDDEAKTATEPAVQEPATEQPAAEQPAAEKPAADEPSVEEPVASSGKHDRSDDEDDGWIGPMPTEAVPVKKRKGTSDNVGVGCNPVAPIANT